MPISKKGGGHVTVPYTENPRVFYYRDHALFSSESSPRFTRGCARKDHCRQGVSLTQNPNLPTRTYSNYVSTVQYPRYARSRRPSPHRQLQVPTIPRGTPSRNTEDTFKCNNNACVVSNTTRDQLIIPIYSIFPFGRRGEVHRHALQHEQNGCARVQYFAVAMSFCLH